VHSCRQTCEFSSRIGSVRGRARNWLWLTIAMDNKCGDHCSKTTEKNPESQAANQPDDKLLSRKMCACGSQFGKA